jgi:hypothetical protein
MADDDTANETPEGRAGLPDYAVVKDATVWMGNSETGESTHEHFHELSEFVVYFCQNVGTAGQNTDGDFYTLLSNTLPTPTRDHHWRADLLFFAVTIWGQDKANQRRKDGMEIFKALLPPLNSEPRNVLIELMAPLKKPHQKMGFWCMGVRRLKEKYSIDPPDTPDFGRVIYNKAVRLNLEAVLEKSLEEGMGNLKLSRPMPCDANGVIDEAKILSDWEADKRNGHTKDCTSVENAASFYTEAMAFLQLLPQVGFRKTIRADHRRLQKIYSDEFPELYGQFLGENTIESILPTHVLKMYREMPLPDQTGFVEMLRIKAQSHKLLGGTLDTTFLRQLNHEIRQGITHPMYEGWARVFQMRDKDRNMPLLKMVINMSYLSMFIQDFQDDEKLEEQMALANEATKRLQDVCDTNILMGEALAPYFL